MANESASAEVLASGTSLACSSSINVAAGDLIVAIATWGGGTDAGTIGISDGGSNTCTLTSVGSYTDVANVVFGYILATSSNSTATFTFTNSTARAYRGIIVFKIEPATAGNVWSLDPGASNPAFANNIWSATAASSAITTTSTTGVAVGGMRGGYDGRTFSVQTINGDGAPDVIVELETTALSTAFWGALAAGASYYSQVTLSSDETWVCGILGFKQEAGGGSLFQTNYYRKLLQAGL